MNSRKPRSLAAYSGAARRRKLSLVVPVLEISTAITLKDKPNLGGGFLDRPGNLVMSDFCIAVEMRTR